MQTRRLIIKENRRPYPVRVASEADFLCEEGPAIDPETVLDDPCYSLYCFDPEKQAALFVQTSAEIDLTRAPFYYQAQAQHATGLVEMPLETFHSIAERIPMPEKGVVFIHSTGRCGSTLVSKVLEAAPAVHSLSEPDSFTQLTILRQWDGSKDAWISPALKSGVLWHCKQRHGVAAEQVAIKTRSEVMEIADLLCPLFPDAKNLFLYRDAPSWLRSVYRIGSKERPYEDVELNRQMEDSFTRLNHLVSEVREPANPLYPMQIWSLVWSGCVESYLKLQTQGIPFNAMRFADIVADPRWMVGELSRFCGIDHFDGDALEQALAKDSQEGTFLDRKTLDENDRRLPDDIRDDCVAMIQARGLDSGTDLVLPGTTTWVTRDE